MPLDSINIIELGSGLPGFQRSGWRPLLDGDVHRRNSMKRDTVLTSKRRVDIWKFFEERARHFSRQAALSGGDETVTFSELFAAADSLAARLAKSGLKEGATVALCLENSISFVPVVLALMKARATIALVSPRYGPSEMRAITGGIRPAFLLSRPSFSAELGPHIGPVRYEEVDSSSRLLKGLTLGSLVSSQPHFSECSLLKVTSGSTGMPKVVALSPGNVVAEAQTVVGTMQCTPADKILCTTPICHSYAFDLGVLAMLASGAELVIHDSFVPRKAVRDIETRGITVFLGVPSIYRTLLDMRIAQAPDLSRVRYLLSCTAPLSPQLIETFYRKFNATLCQHYGSSETGAVALHIPTEVRHYPNAVGVPMKGVQIQIVNGEGKGVSAGSEGEVLVTSGAVGSGYIMGQPNGVSPFSGSSFRMPDLGRIDQDGFLRITGRSDDMIEIGGLKVSPLEITAVLQGCAQVREAAVLGVTDSRGESAIYAAVTLTGSTTERQLLAFCRSQLADYKVPRRIEILPEFPRTPSGKISLRKDHISL
jgi:long-chain acyl-CoA synthetase